MSERRHPLPDAALDADIAILGKKGRGKTYAAKGIVERLLELQRRVLILDPLSTWWGLRSSADGKSAGFPVAVFGGPKADMPLTDTMGQPLARVIAGNNLPIVLDMGEMRKAAWQRLVGDLFDELFAANRDPLWIVLEEADVFAPQQPREGDSARVLGEVDRIARRGRAYGFRLISITQRPARLHKDVLTQLSTLVALGLTSPQDRDAIKAWVEGNADRDQARAVMDSLASLPVGEGWVWAPDHGLLERVKFPPIATLDTSATPKAGEKRIEPKTLADVDLAPIREALAAASDSPAINGSKKGSGIAPDPAALAEAEQRGYERGRAEAFAAGRGAGRMEAARELVASLPGWIMAMAAAPAVSVVAAQPNPIAATKRQPLGAPSGEDEKINTGRTGPQKHLLKALAWWRAMHHDRPTRTQVAAIAGWKPKGSNLRNRLSELSGLGLVVYPSEGRVSLTPEGAAAAPAPDLNVTLIDSIRAVLTGPQGVLFEALLAAGGTIGRTELASRVGWEPGGSNLRNRLSELSALEVVEYPSRGGVRLQDWVTE